MVFGQPLRQLDDERRAFADDTLDADAAVVLLDDLPAHTQPQAGAAVAVLVGQLGREERLEDLPQVLRGDPGTRVGDLDLDRVAVVALADFEPQAAAVEHRLAGVDDEVQDDLLDLPRHDHGRRPALEALLDLDAVLAQVLLGENQDLLDDGDEVGRLAVGRVVAGEAEHAVDDPGSALAAAQDLLEGLHLGGGGLAAAAHLGVVDDRGEDVVELVGDARREFADAAEPLGLQQLLPQGVGLGHRHRGRFLSRHETSPGKNRTAPRRVSPGPVSTGPPPGVASGPSGLLVKSIGREGCATSRERPGWRELAPRNWPGVRPAYPLTRSAALTPPRGLSASRR